MQMVTRDTGSFRDPSAYVFHDGDRVIRAVTESAAARFAAIYDSGVLARLAEKGLMIECRRLDPDDATMLGVTGARGENFSALYEHPRVPFITYPYEWCFSQLKAAALAHLDLQIAAFEEGYALSDATAYNIQFVNGKPIHIDVTSIIEYENGDVWAGYNQFCRQFLLPLLLEAWSGITFQSTYRGAIAGIDFRDALAILPRRKLFSSPAGFTHVYLHGKAVSRSSSSSSAKPRKQAPLKRSHYLAMLVQLRGFVEKLESRLRPASYWAEYAEVNSYSDKMRDEKISFVRDWAAKCKPGIIIDIGGNTGDFSKAALAGGAQRSIIVDSDLDSIEWVYRQVANSNIAILPILMNLVDPTPDMGWRQTERKGFGDRAKVDGVIALAVLHHMVISGNLPLEDAIDWIISRAPEGIIEFVPKRDPMVKGLLAMRDDIFPDYNEDNFRRLVSSRARIDGEHFFESNGRLLVSYSRK